jgi:hypothetical protein
MTVNERNRLQLADALKRVLGDSEGITLMELLPPVGWADVATRHDLLALEQRFDVKLEALESRFDARFTALESRMELRFASIDAQFARMDHKFDLLRAELIGAMDRRARTQLLVMVSTFTALAGVIVAAIRL